MVLWSGGLHVEWVSWESFYLHLTMRSPVIDCVPAMESMAAARWLLIEVLLLLGTLGHAYDLFLQRVFVRLGCVTSTISPVVETSAPVAACAAAAGMSPFAQWTAATVWAISLRCCDLRVSCATFQLHSSLLPTAKELRSLILS